MNSKHRRDRYANGRAARLIRQTTGAHARGGMLGNDRDFPRNLNSKHQGYTLQS